ncbi:MAG: hypothetical protein MZW92_19855 [Comamonadaceae bacterium]|nr:hypothetical protein [Comamonadaceae bacterium]
MTGPELALTPKAMRWQAELRAAAAGLHRRGAARDRFHQHRADAPRARRPDGAGAAGGRDADGGPRPAGQGTGTARAGQSLTFSLALPLAPADWSGLSLAVGVSLADSLHPQVRLKWPNDLWLDQRKLGGILVETASHGDGQLQRTVVIGVGINIARPDSAQVAAPGHPGGVRSHGTRRAGRSAHGHHRRVKPWPVWRPRWYAMC